MGRSIDLHDYEIKKLWLDFKELANVANTAENYEKFLYVLKLHGVIVYDRFLILNNEFYEDYNRYYRLTDSLVIAFDLVDRSKYIDEEGELKYKSDEEFKDTSFKLSSILDRDEPHKSYWESNNCEIDAGDRYDVYHKIIEYKKENENHEISID